MQTQTTLPTQNPIPRELLEAAALWYRGGYTVPAPGGYLREYNPFHPYGSRRGLVMQHRLVMERMIGRILARREVVRHRNGNRQDNAPDNLELLHSQAAHMEHEHSERRKGRYLRDPGLVGRVLQAAQDPKASMSKLADMSPHSIRRICLDHGVTWRSGSCLTEHQVRTALLGRSTEDAAAALGVHHQTLRNHFDHLLTKRRSPGYYDERRTEIQQIAKDHSAAEAARRFGTHRAVIRKCLLRWSAQDAKSAATASQAL